MGRLLSSPLKWPSVSMFILACMEFSSWIKWVFLHVETYLWGLPCNVPNLSQASFCCCLLCFLCHFIHVLSPVIHYPPLNYVSVNSTYPSSADALSARPAPIQSCLHLCDVLFCLHLNCPLKYKICFVFPFFSYNILTCHFQSTFYPDPFGSDFEAFLDSITITSPVWPEFLCSCSEYQYISLFPHFIAWSIPSIAILPL